MAYRSTATFPIGWQLGLPLLGAITLAVALRGLFPIESVATWLIDPGVLAGFLFGGQLWFVIRYLLPSWTAQDRPFSLFGLANTLTLVRGALYAIVAGFVVVPPGTSLEWVPAVAYGTGMLLDKLDGTVARTVGEQTVLGAKLDMAFDTFGFVAAPLVAVLWGWLPVWYLSLSAARYLYRGGLSWQQHRGRQLFEPPDSDLGKYLAGIQMVFLTIALIPATPTKYVYTVAPFVLLPSLLVFTRDYLVVTGRLSWETQ